jgi:aryl-alcohol dehydrogenase-like predicted oxidoreductase
LKRLDVEEIDIYYQHHVDIKVPIEITVRDAPSCPCDAVACES